MSSCTVVRLVSVRNDLVTFQTILMPFQQFSK
jgi:hypothetical protein